MDEINKYLCCKYKLNGVNLINRTDVTLQDGSQKPNLFYVDKLHLIEERTTKLGLSIYSSINPKGSLNKGVSVSSKLFACEIGFNLNRDISLC